MERVIANQGPTVIKNSQCCTCLAFLRSSSLKSFVLAEATHSFWDKSTSRIQVKVELKLKLTDAENLNSFT